MAVLQKFASYLAMPVMALAILHMTNTQYSTANQRWRHSANIKKARDNQRHLFEGTCKEKNGYFERAEKEARETRISVHYGAELRQ